MSLAAPRRAAPLVRCAPRLHRSALRRAPCAAAPGAQQQQQQQQQAQGKQQQQQAQGHGQHHNSTNDEPGLPQADHDDSSRPRYNTGFRFDREKWDEHRAEGRYWQWASTLLGSRLIRRTLPPAIFLAALALGIQLFNVLVPEAYAIKGLPLRSFALSTTFVGLLLVFRTNGSYQRFQNGLNSFIECLYANRNLVRQALSWLTPEEALLRDRFLEYSAAWGFCLTYHLLYDKEGDPAEVQKLRNALASVGVRPITIDRIATAHNRPTYVAQTLSLLVSRSSLSEQKKTEMDRVITQLMSTMGQCERLRQHPIPVSYTRLTSYTLLFWSLGLAFAITPPLGWAGVPLILFLSLALLGIEDVGVQIEEPFSYLPLWQMCRANSLELWEMKRQALDIARSQAAWDSELADSMTLWQTTQQGFDSSVAAEDVMPRAPPLYLADAMRRDYGDTTSSSEDDR